MTMERYNDICNEIEKIRSSDITDEEMAEAEMFLFNNREEFNEFSDIENGICKPITKQDILEEIADEKYNAMKEA